MLCNFSFSAIAGTPENGKSATNTQTDPPKFHYVGGTSEGDYANPGNWREGPSDDPSCMQGLTRPCEIIAEDEGDLSSQLLGKDNAAVLPLCETRKP